MRDFLLRLYPAAWRARYGDEFDAVLAERPLGPFDVVDVLFGAVDAHLHRRGRAASKHRKGLTMSRHLGGTAAVIGGGLLIASQVVNTVSEFHGEFVMLAGMGALVVAMAGLSPIQSRQHPIGTWAVFGVAAVGMLGWPICGIVGYFVEPTGDWVLVRVITFLALIGGTALFGALTYRTGDASRPAAAVLALSGTFMLVGLVSVTTNVYTVQGLGWLGLLFSVGAVGFPIGWIALGWAAIRLDRSPAVAATPSAAS